MAKASAPVPFIICSATVSAMAIAIAASTAFPPLASTGRPACAANGWLVTTPSAVRIGGRIVG